MNLYLLRPIRDAIDDPWGSWYDKCFGFVIRAENEAHAREIADLNAGDENRTSKPNAWLDPDYSTCEILDGSGDAGMVMQDFHSA